MTINAQGLFNKLKYLFKISFDIYQYKPSIDLIFFVVQDTTNKK